MDFDQVIISKVSAEQHPDFTGRVLCKVTMWLDCSEFQASELTRQVSSNATKSFVTINPGEPEDD
jgi:hypothetical protein